MKTKLTPTQKLGLSNFCEEKYLEIFNLVVGDYLELIEKVALIPDKEINKLKESQKIRVQLMKAYCQNIIANTELLYKELSYGHNT